MAYVKTVISQTIVILTVISVPYDVDYPLLFDKWL